MDKEIRETQHKILTAIYDSSESPRTVMPRTIEALYRVDPETASRLDECWEHTKNLVNDFNGANRRRRAHLRASLIALGIRISRNG